MSVVPDKGRPEALYFSDQLDAVTFFEDSVYKLRTSGGGGGGGGDATAANQLTEIQSLADILVPTLEIATSTGYANTLLNSINSLSGSINDKTADIKAAVQDIDFYTPGISENTLSSKNSGLAIETYTQGTQNQCVAINVSTAAISTSLKTVIATSVIWETAGANIAMAGKLLLSVLDKVTGAKLTLSQCGMLPGGANYNSATTEFQPAGDELLLMSGDGYSELICGQNCSSKGTRVLKAINAPMGGAIVIFGTGR